MDKSAKSQLTEIVRDIIATDIDSDAGARPREIGRKAVEMAADIAGSCATLLLEDWLTNTARHELKRWSGINTKDARQMVLPGINPAILKDIAASYYIPSEVGEGVFKSVTRMTPGDLDMANEYLQRGINSDNRKLLAGQELVKAARAAGCRDDQPMSEALNQKYGSRNAA